MDKCCRSNDFVSKLIVILDRGSVVITKCLCPYNSRKKQNKTLQVHGIALGSLEICQWSTNCVLNALANEIFHKYAPLSTIESVLCISFCKLVGPICKWPGKGEEENLSSKLMSFENTPTTNFYLYSYSSLPSKHVLLKYPRAD